MNKKSITIIGPTASGKSRMAILLAQELGGEIISADSRQIHRDLSIGTGKEPGKIVQQKGHVSCTQYAYISDDVPHYMIDIVHPNTPYNVAKYVKKSIRIRENIWRRNKIPIVCGGTMFWAQALIEGQTFPAVLPNKLLRQSLSKLSLKKLLAILTKIDPLYARKVDVNNPVRIIRAIEIAQTLGKVPEHVSHKIDPKDHLIFAIIFSRPVLHEKIERRMNLWFCNGIFDEIINAHHTLHVPWKRLESFGLEYKWCTRFVRGLITFDDMRNHIIHDLKQYAKRQETWIRRWEKQGAPIQRITSITEAHTHIKKFLKK